MYGLYSGFKELRTVLIVGGDNTSRRQLRALFNHGSGFDACVEAGNGVEALAETKRQEPNLAVLDFSMPGMNGLQLAPELKAIAPELPIFLLTADYQTDIEKEALCSGITAVFSKLDDLRRSISAAIRIGSFDDGGVKARTRRTH